jgi:hypothetical protein
MEGGDLYNMFKTANRKVIKNVLPYALGAAGTAMPMIVGQPELIPAGLAVAGLLNEAGKAALPVYGKNKKRIAKLEAKAKKVETPPKPSYYSSPYQTSNTYTSTYTPTYTSTYTPTPTNNISSDSNMPVRRYIPLSQTRGSGLHAPRSRGGGHDMFTPMAQATLGHSHANAMLGKLESHLAQARQHNQGLVGVSGNLINQIAPLQSQPQQNFQFRHTLITPAFHPSVFGNNY